MCVFQKNSQLEERTEEIRSKCEKSWQTKVDLMQKEMEDMKKTHEEQMHQLYAKYVVNMEKS